VTAVTDSVTRAVASSMVIFPILKAWLIEVNASPSLTADTPQDCELKFGRLDDLYSLASISIH